jgi:RNA polymerase sigma-70 factor (ECF subfamily)
VDPTTIPTGEIDGPHSVEGIRAEDPEVLAAVVEACLPQVLRAARGAGLRPDEAEEVVQDTFASFLEAAPRFEGRSHVRTFLFAILFRKISEMHRGRALDRRHDPIDDVVEARFKPDGTWSRPPKASDRMLRIRELRRFLAECLERSPTSQRLAFLLREVEGLSTDEICKILSVTATNLGVMLYRLRNRTRECLEAKDVSA